MNKEAGTGRRGKQCIWEGLERGKGRENCSYYIITSKIYRNIKTPHFSFFSLMGGDVWLPVGHTVLEHSHACHPRSDDVWGLRYTKSTASISRRCHSHSHFPGPPRRLSRQISTSTPRALSKLLNANVSLGSLLGINLFLILFFYLLSSLATFLINYVIFLK